MQFGTNYLGHFALTARLMPLLRRASGPRVVNVSSLAHRTAFIDFDDLQGARIYSPWKAYGQSKLAMLMFALELQRRSDATGWNLTSNAAHPGFARTGLFASGPGGLLSLASDLRRSVFRSIGNRRSSSDPVRGDKSPSKAGRLLWTRRTRRITRRPGAGPDHAPGSRRGKGGADFGMFPRNSTGRLSIDGKRCNSQRTSSTSDFRLTIWSRCCGSGSRMPDFASTMCCRFAAGRNNTGMTR